ncbi:MAG: TolC family protein [Magnetococcales bacterium]|nr:TolC family protein [Magnetococcales bacterium]MBF0150068.1 TolC family protein [Magnetococcales bacterium]
MKQRGDSIAGVAYRAAMAGVLVLVVTYFPVFTVHSAVQGEEREKMVLLQTLLDPALTDQDQSTLGIIQKSFVDARASGDWDPSERLSLVHLSMGNVLRQALHRNLAIQIGRMDTVIASRTIAEVDAVFAPLFQMKLNHAGSMVYERQRSGMVKIKQFLPTPTQGEPYLDINPPPPGRYQVDRIGFLSQKSDTVNKTHDLSKRQEPGWLDTDTGSLTIQQQLPWGPHLTLTKDTTYKEVYYDPNLEKSWDAPWAIGVKASLNTPLPFGKNFGPYSDLDTSLKQVNLADQQTDWTLKAIINETLRNADLAYWDLVHALENLAVAIENRHDQESLALHAERMLEVYRITKYGRDQMVMELARAKVGEASARQALVTASATLALLIENEHAEVGDSLLLPVGYHQRLEVELKSPDPLEAVNTALKRRPELHIKELDYQSGLVARLFRENQIRPDVVFSGSGTMKQSNDTYGYKTFTESLGHVLDPDRRGLSASVGYTYPWRNRAAKAALAQAAYGVEHAALSQQALEQGVRKEVDDALVSLASTRARLNSARNNEKLAVLALEKARDRWKVMGDMSEMELSRQSRNVLSARLARVAAMIDNKKAETLLAAAQGTLAEGMIEQTAVSMFDRRRLALLADSGAIPHFVIEKKKGAGGLP